jgi:hypothetical protein
MQAIVAARSATPPDFIYRRFAGATETVAR